MILFKCNPLLNVNCGKVCCGTLCHETTHPEFAVLDEYGNPIVTYISEEEMPVTANDIPVYKEPIYKKQKMDRNDIVGGNRNESD